MTESPVLLEESAAKPAHRSRLRPMFSAWLPVLFCVFVIACESTVYFGADHTSGTLRRFVEFLLHRRLTQPQWWWLHIRIRKCGHFAGYGLLSASWFRAFWMTLRLGANPYRRWLDAHLLAMLGTFLVASCDEFHQLFLPNRNGSIVDVGIDCLGGLAMQIGIAIWMRSRL